MLPCFCSRMRALSALAVVAALNSNMANMYVFILLIAHAICLLAKIVLKFTIVKYQALQYRCTFIPTFGL